MLIITRRLEEAIVIEIEQQNEIKAIEVMIIGMKKQRIHIGIKAPPEISVHREEIYQRIQAQEQAEQQEHLLDSGE